MKILVYSNSSQDKLLNYAHHDVVLGCHSNMFMASTLLTLLKVWVLLCVNFLTVFL